MNVKNVEKKENGKLTFQVEFDSAEFDKAVNRAYLKAKKDILIPGFRKGKAPRVIVENMYGAGVFYEDAVNELAPEAYENGVKESGAKVVGRPAITDFNVADDKSLTIDFTVALYPEVTLGQYKELEVYKKPAEVTDEEVENELKKIQKRNERIVVVERAAIEGDTVNIDYDGYRDGVRFAGGKDEGHDLVLGSHSFVPGFEEQLIGVKAGDEKDLDITFPENYHADLAGAQVVFKVKVNEVKESQLPKLDDDFAKDVSEFDTLDEYKASIRGNLLKNAEEDSQREFESAAIEKAVGNMTVAIPDEMIDDQLDKMVEDYSHNCAMQGMTLDQYLGMMGMDINRFRSAMRPAAERQTKTEVLLAAIAEAEGIVPTDEEIEEEYKKQAEMYGVELDRVKSVVDAEMMAGDLKIKAAAKVIFDSTVITDKAPKEEKPAEAETEEATEAE